MRIITLSRKLWRGCSSRSLNVFFIRVDPNRIVQVFSPQLGESCFLHICSAISRKKRVRNSTRDKEDVCPGYDANGDVPIGCSVTEDDLIAMGVIRQ